MKLSPWIAGAAVVIVGGGILTALDPAEPAPTTTQPPATTSAPRPTEASECLPVSDDFAQQIIGEHKLEQAAAAQSADTGTYFVAVRFTHDAGTDVGVWQATNLEGGPFGSVDAFARSYTNWPPTGNEGAPAQRLAEGCLR